MVIYVAHCYSDVAENVEKAKRIVHDLQTNDTENCYVCPLIVFSHLAYNEIGREAEMQLCEDLLTVCDKLLVASEITEGVRREIELAEKIHMEVSYLNDTI